MKRTIIITGLSSVIVIASLALSGCLKDKLADQGKAGFTVNKNDKIAELAGNKELTIALEASATDTTFGLVKVRIAADKPVNRDTKVTLALKQSLIDAYNTAHGTTYAVPPAALYTLDNLTVTIPAGSREGQLGMKVKPDNLIGSDYAFGFTIVSSDDPAVTISGNFKDQFIILGVKNAYDGIYIIKGEGFHPTPALVGHFEYTDCDAFTLVTANANAVDLQPGQPTNNGGGIGVFAVYPRFTIDPVTKAVTVSGAPGNSVVFDPQPSYNSRYDPVTKTLYVKLGWSGTRVYTDTLIYCGPR
ncbi:MAG: DUF1735 domain-containing protein [Chitinophagaceae bacterium]